MRSTGSLLTMTSNAPDSTTRWKRSFQKAEHQLDVDFDRSGLPVLQMDSLAALWSPLRTHWILNPMDIKAVDQRGAILSLYNAG
jgi:hypothetical protein